MESLGTYWVCSDCLQFLVNDEMPPEYDPENPEAYPDWSPENVKRVMERDGIAHYSAGMSAAEHECAWNFVAYFRTAPTTGDTDTAATDDARYVLRVSGDSPDMQDAMNTLYAYTPVSFFATFTAVSIVKLPDWEREDVCVCETNTFSTSACEGCGSALHGERHALTAWPREPE